MRIAYALLALLALSGCVTAPSPAPPPAPSAPEVRGGAGAPSLDLGDWRSAVPAHVQRDFAASVARHVGAADAPQALGVLRANRFICAPAADGGSSQVCERRVVEAGCVHVWQAVVGAGAAGPARAYYDRTCEGRSGLLGAPPQ